MTKVLSSIEIVSYGSQQCTAVVRIKRVASLKYVTQLLVMATSEDQKVDNCCWFIPPTKPPSSDGGHYCKDLIEMSPSITPLVAGFISLVMVVAQISHYYALTSHLPDQAYLINSSLFRSGNELVLDLKLRETKPRIFAYIFIFHSI